jgi:hypothetical protein
MTGPFKEYLHDLQTALAAGNGLRAYPQARSQGPLGIPGGTPYGHQ